MVAAIAGSRRGTSSGNETTTKSTLRWPARATSAERKVETIERPQPPRRITVASAAGEPTCHSRRIANAGTESAAIARKRTKLNRALPASTTTPGASLRRASPVPVSSSRTNARGRPVAAEKKSRIQRSEASSPARASGGIPKGPTA
jgi:hypothetical protein